MRALHLLDQDAHPLGLLERERIVLGQLRHEAQDGKLGVAVHEHVLDELVRREAVDRVGVAARALREARQDALPVLAGVAPPLAGRIDHVGLHVEDELVAGDGLGGGCRLELRLAGQNERAAGIAARRERLVERQKRGRGPAQRLQEGPPGHARAPGVRGDPLARQRIRPGDGLAHRDRPELAVGSGIDFDRESTVCHHMLPPAELLNRC